jgi:prepilin peptidase dependent protein B
MLIRQRGFSLLETLFAIGLSSILMIGIASLLPKMIGSYLMPYRLHRIEQSLTSVMFRIEKDLRRTGFILQGHVAEPLVLHQGSAEGLDCLILRYDLNGNGKIDISVDGQDERFGYRLHDGALEMKRGTFNCDGKNWQKVTDPNDINVIQFNVEPLRAQGNDFIVRIAGHWPGRPTQRKEMVRVIRALNL